MKIKYSRIKEIKFYILEKLLNFYLIPLNYFFLFRVLDHFSKAEKEKLFYFVSHSLMSACEDVIRFKGSFWSIYLIKFFIESEIFLFSNSS